MVRAPPSPPTTSISSTGGPRRTLHVCSRFCCTSMQRCATTSPIADCARPRVPRVELWPLHTIAPTAARGLANRHPASGREESRTHSQPARSQRRRTRARRDAPPLPAPLPARKHGRTSGNRAVLSSRGRAQHPGSIDQAVGWDTALPRHGCIAPDANAPLWSASKNPISGCTRMPCRSWQSCSWQRAGGCR